MFCKRAGEKGENESRDMLLQNLTRPPSGLHSSPTGQAGCTGSCSNCPPPPTPPTYSLHSPPPVSPTHGDQIEFSILTPKTQGPSIVSPSKTQQGTQFGLGATCTSGQFPLRWHPERGQGTPLDLRCTILISPQEPSVTLTVGTSWLIF